MAVCLIVPSYAVGFIYIPGKLDYVSFTTDGAFLCCVQMIEYIMTRWSYPFVCTQHYLIIIIMQTYQKVLNVWNVCQVHSVRVYVYGLTHFSYTDYENTCILSYYHHQMGSMTNLPLFRIRSLNKLYTLYELVPRSSLRLTLICGLGLFSIYSWDFGLSVFDGGNGFLFASQHLFIQGFRWGWTAIKQS